VDAVDLYFSEKTIIILLILAMKQIADDLQG